MVAKLQSIQTNEATMTSQAERRGVVSGHMYGQKMEVGVVEVLTTEVTNSLAPSRGIFVTEKTTCRDLVQMIINIDQLKGSPELYTLYEVDSNSRVGRQLADDDRPLNRQRFWLDPHECFFQLRLNGERQKFRMRRAQSLENLADIRNFNQRLLSRKLSRKSRAPSEKSAWQMPSNNDVSKLPRDATGNRGQMTNAMTKLKDSVSKLREHLDKFQRRKSMPAVPGTHCHQDPRIMTSENNGDGEQDGSHSSPRHSHDGVQGISVSRNVGDKLFHSLDDSRLSDSMLQDSSERSQTSAQTGEDTGAESSASRNESDAGPSIRQQPNNTRQNSAAVLMRKKRRSRADPDLLDLSSPDCQNTTTTRPSLQEFNSQLAARTSHLSSKSTKSRPAHSKEAVRTRRRHSEALDDDDIVQGHRKVNQVEKRRSLQDVSSLFSAHYKHGAIVDAGLSSKDRETETASSSATSRHRVSSHASLAHSPGSTVSNASSKSTKPRRTLPQIPQTESDLEARKQRISIEAMSRVKLARGGSQHARQAKYRESHSPRKNETGSDEDDRESVKTLSGDGDSVFEETEPALCYNLQTAGLVRPKPSKSTPHPKARNRYVHPSDATSFKNTSRSPEDYTDCTDQYHDVPSNNISDENHSTTQNGHSSHYSLQQIITDLRNAANSGYTPPMQSFSSASSQDPFEHAHAHAHSRKPEMGLDVSPLARPTPREDPSEYADLQSSHPSLHRITASYDLHTVVLENSDPGYVVDYGIDVYEASFIDCPSSGRALNGVAASPAGRRALIGRKRGAFRPVSTCGSMESGPMLSLVAVDSILDESVAANSGDLHEGDYIIEVNGMYVANSSAAVAMSEISKQQHVLQLVIARPKTKVATPVGDQEKSEAMLAMCKDKDKLQLKYNAIKMESEKSLDQIAELRLELQTKNTVISHLEEILAQRDSTLSNMETQSLKRDKAIYEWQAEVEKRNMDIAHLETEVRQREERIAQLRKLLIQQSEVMQFGGVMGGDYNPLEYRDEKVSAV